MKKTHMQVLLLALLLLCQTACGVADTTDTTAADTTPETETIPETERAYFDPQGASYGGADFTIWNYDNEHDNGWSGIPDDLCASEANGDVLNDAVYSRNLLVAETLDLQWILEKKSSGAFETQLQSLIAAGDSSVDLCFPRQYCFATMVDKEVLLDLNSVDTFDFSQPWWNQNAVETLTLHGQLYGVTSDATYYDKLSTYVTFYNRKLAEDHALGDLNAMVQADEWTLDKMLDLGMVLSADVNGDGLRDEKDAYPISCQNDGVYILLHAARIPIAAKDEEGQVRFNLTGDLAVNTLQSIYELMGDGTRFFNRQTYSLTFTDAIAMFNEERALFLIRPVQSLFNMRDMDADFGILPLPKITENQTDYGSAINPYAATFSGIPLSVADPTRSATVLSLLACESYYSVRPVFYDIVLGSKLIRDDTSAQILDIVFDSSFYDPGLLWNFGGITDTLLTNTGTNVSSMLAGVSTRVDTAIDKLNDKLSN